MLHYLEPTTTTSFKTDQNGETKENKEDYDDQGKYYDMCLTNDPKYLAPIRNLERKFGFVTPLIWKNVILMALAHIVLAYQIVMYFMYSKDRLLFSSIVQILLYGYMAGFGITAGIHRLWSHRSYKVKTPFKIFLLLCFALTGQKTVYRWVRDHRVHHKRCDTSGDPHDASRGFFFSHIGWFMMKKHPHVITEGAKIDMSDITGDPILVFFDRHYGVFKLLICFVIPALIPVWVFGETWANSLLTVNLRYFLTLHLTWCVNSFAHMYGSKPYDKNIMPSQNVILSVLLIGEGWHNYHHTFPWDYKSAELPYFINLTTLILDAAALVGQVFDRKVATPAIVKAIAQKKGDSSWKIS
ncbi:stearoyl-CoA desaturase 5-like isoform X1 [Leptidea sinapis]|uniref:stearoyl-CoA desaturase 5-like isoform X1 n=2 Tax=Leptidea sinapis TaxID=189913 RepID=UPI0021C2EF92|nr:stearoyl-CoA desaturase 5-like isoform X1 [Leptidea sinapis]